MPGPESRPEFVDGKPFIIRGHHLRYYAILINRRYLSPPVMAAFLILSIGPPVLEIKQSRREYVKDVLGSSLKQTYRFGRNSSRAFREFLRLPDNYPVEIVEGVPDAICAGCAAGEHCRRLIQFKKNAIVDDGVNMDKLVKNLDLLNLPKPTISLEEASFSDADPQQVRRLRTTIGVVKMVLKKDRSFYIEGKS